MRAPRRTRRTRASLGVTALIVTVGVVASGCGASTSTTATKTTAAPTTAAGGAPSASLPTASTVAVSGGDGFCAKLANFPTKLEQSLSSLSTSPSGALQAEYSEFQSLAASGPSAIRAQLLDIANYFETADKDATSGNPAALQGLSQQAAQLGTASEQIGQWEATHCSAG